jgi:hypothetical protein
MNAAYISQYREMNTLYAVSFAQLPHIAVKTRVCPGGATDKKLSFNV